MSLHSALSDVSRAVHLRRVWVALASEDIGDQHRRTALGPIWLLANYLAFAGTFIFVFNAGGNVPGLAAHVATGLFVWFYIMETVNQSLTLFVREESFIKGTVLPLSVYVMRLTMQSAIRAGYALAGCLAVLALSGTTPTIAWLASLAAMLLIFLATPGVIMCFAFLGAYIPDSQFLVQNAMRIGMFLTPVFWFYEGSGGIRHALYWWNPFTYFLEIVRLPVTSGSIPWAAFAFCGAVALCAWVLALALLGRLRKQVVFVL